MKKDFLVLLDLDNTLITSELKKNITNGEITNKLIPDIDASNLGLKPEYIFIRPYLNEFLSFLFDNFYVGLWSAANEKWISTICSQSILRNYKDKFLFIWNGSMCKNKEKPLQKVWKMYSEFNRTNTILIDDVLGIRTPNIRNRLNINKYQINNQMYNDIELLKIKKILENDNKINNIIKKYKIYKYETNFNKLIN